MGTYKDKIQMRQTNLSVQTLGSRSTELTTSSLVVAFSHSRHHSIAVLPVLLIPADARDIETML